MKSIAALVLFSVFSTGIFSQPLNGSYTIGGSSPDFATFQNAANALKVNGVSGPVTFNIRPGIYMKDNGETTVMILDSIITGSSSTNRITFQPDAATGGNVDNVILKVDFSNNSLYYEKQIVKVQTDFVTIRNLSFIDADSLDVPASYLIRIQFQYFINPAVDDIVIDGCKFIGAPYYTQGQQYGTNYGIYSDNLATASVTNSQFSNLNRGVGLDVETGGVGGNSVIVEDNRFDHLYLNYTGSGTPIGSAIEVEFPQSFVRRNFVSNSSGATGINVVYPVIAELEANYVSGNYINGQMATSPNTAAVDRADSLRVFNNILMGSANSGCLQVRTRNTKLFHNTIVHNGSFGSKALWISAENCSVLNNIVLAYGCGLMYEQLEATNLISDHNVFYSTCTYFVRSSSGQYCLDLEGYQVVTGLDLNSKFSDVNFEFDSLGIHLGECEAQNSALNGLHLNEVPFDYYGAIRDTIKPFVGAVEGVRLPYDMFGAPFRTSLTGFPLSITTGDFDHSNSIGIALPDWDNRKVLLFHNNVVSRTFTQSGTVFTTLQPSLVKLFDLDEDDNLDLIVSGDTNAVEIFWGDGNGGFSGSEIVETLGKVRSLEAGPRFASFSTIITTEDGFEPYTSLIGYIMSTSGRQFCYDAQRSGPSAYVDTINAVLTDFVLADLGAGENMPAIVAPGLFGSTTLIPCLFSFDVEEVYNAVGCPNINAFFASNDHQDLFPITGYYTNSSSIITGDFDGDLDKDFITTGFSQNYCLLIKNNGSFTFSSDTIFTSATRGLAVLDYENDGDLDFVTVNNTLDSLGITTFLNDGVGNFTEKRNCYFPFASGHPNGIVAADFDQDGKTDIAIVSRSFGGYDSLFVLYNLGGFNQPTNVTTPDPTEEIPEKFELSQNYPNPFNPSTTIEYSLPFESDVEISVFNILGEKVRELVNSQMTAGNHSVNFNASYLASGLYIYRIEAKSLSQNINFINAKKMILLK
jgi:hypothetical protein